MPTQKTPGVYVDETTGTRAVAPASTGATAFVGHTLEGPINRVVPVKSFTEYSKTFGGLAASSEVSYAVLQFFRNGGEKALIVRVPELDTGLPDLGMVSGASSSVPIGLGCLNADDEFELLCVPDTTRPREPGGSLSEFPMEEMVELWRAAIALCRRKRALFILDAPVDTVSTGAAQTLAAALPREMGSFAAAYAPWIWIDNPLHEGQQRRCAPGGSIAGLYARTDKNLGVWKSPAGTDANLRNVRRLAASFSDAEQAILNPLAINLLREFPGHGFVAWSARTLDISGDWTFVPVRRLANHIERSLTRGLHWTAFEANGEALWAQLRRSAGDFLNTLFRRGAFAGETQTKSYFVKCGPDTTTEADIAQGHVNVQIGFAALKPAEFVILRLQFTTQPPNA